MEYIYPAVFSCNKDGSYTIIFPDLPGCISEGKSLGNAMVMSQSALTQWIGFLTENNQAIPEASSISELTSEPHEFISLIRAEGKESRAVKRTVSIPKWMDDEVIKAGLSLSRVLQDALSERLR